MKRKLIEIALEVNTFQHLRFDFRTTTSCNPFEHSTLGFITLQVSRKMQCSSILLLAVHQEIDWTVSSFTISTQAKCAIWEKSLCCGTTPRTELLQKGKSSIW